MAARQYSSTADHEHGATLDLAAREPLRRRLDDLELCDGGLAEARYLGEPLRRGGDHLRKRAELSDQDFGERLDVAPRQRAEQYQLQQLVIGDRIGAGLAEATAQPLAMPVIMRRRLLEPGLRQFPASLVRHDVPSAWRPGRHRTHHDRNC
jgi:hypothetical protein